MSVVEAPALVLHSSVIATYGDADPAQPTTSNIWVKVPQGVEYLGAPPPVLESSPIPPNAIPAPSWFNPNKPDLGALFGTLLPINKPAVYAQYLPEGAKPLSPVNEISTVDIVLKAYPVIGYSANDIKPKYTDADVVVRVTVEAPYTLADPDAGVFTLTGEPASFALDRGLAVDPGAFTVTYNDAEWYYPVRRIFCDTGNFSGIWQVVANFHFDEYPTYDSIPPGTPGSNILPADSGGGYLVVERNYNVSFDGTVGSPSVPYDRDSPKFGQNSAYAADNTISFRYGFDTPIGYGDFTVDFWIKPYLASAGSVEAIFLLGAGVEKKPDGTDSSRVFSTGMWRVGTGLSFYAYVPATDGASYLHYSENNLNATTTTWQHVAMERWNGELRFYVNGVADQTPYTDIWHDLWAIQHQLFSRNENNRYRGHIDEFRFVRFAAYKGQSFTPPTAPYQYGTQLIYAQQPAILFADPGAFTLTGQNALLSERTTFAADAGSFVLTGQDADFNGARSIAAAKGTYTLTGQAATFTSARKLVGAEGAFTLVGQAANLVLAKIMEASAGAFNLVGQAAALVRGARNLLADPGAYTATGNAATFVYAKTFAAAPATYTLTGQAADFNLQSKFKVDPGAFTLTGQAAQFNYTSAIYTLWVEQNYLIHVEITQPGQVFD